MALIIGQNATRYRPAVSSSDSDVVSVIGRHTVTAAETAAAAAGDVIQLVKLPAGAKIVDAIVFTSIALAGAANLVELTDVAGAAIASSVIVTAGTINTVPARLNNAQAIDLAPQAAETYAAVVLGAAGTLPAGVVVSLELRYRAAWLGD